MIQTLADMRRDYTRDGLSEANAPDDPFGLFRQWFTEATQTEQAPVEPNAMSLATVDADGRPHCRILLLKALDDRGFTFFTNYDSAKGQQLDASPYAAMTFFWPTLERQVRIEGRVEKVTAEESDAYFQVRPLGSRLGAWASPQSQVIRDRAELGGCWPRPSSASSIRRPIVLRTGAATGCCRSASSSGRGGRAACTTDSTIAWSPMAGSASAWRPDSVAAFVPLTPSG